jgi:hypothetical protein
MVALKVDFVRVAKRQTEAANAAAEKERPEGEGEAA